MQHFYQFYEFFGEEKHLGEEGIDLSLSGFREQESLYVKFTFMFLWEIFKFLFSFICREMSSDDEEVGTWWTYFYFSVPFEFHLEHLLLFVLQEPLPPKISKAVKANTKG